MNHITPAPWIDRDESLNEKIEKIAIQESKSFMNEIKADPYLDQKTCHTRAVKSAYADGFSGGLFWAMENPGKVLVMILKSFFRRGFKG